MTDTKIRHVTPPGANIFTELGFPPEEAERLNTVLHTEVDQALTFKRQLVHELSAWIEQHHLKQAQAAEILLVSRPRISDVVNGKTAKFTIDALLQMVGRTGKTVELSIRP